MEEVHGVDVSWVDDTGKAEHRNRRPGQFTIRKDSLQSVPTMTTTAPPTPSPTTTTHDPTRRPGPTHVTPPHVAEPRRDTTTAWPEAPTSQANGASRPASKRPSILSRASSEKMGADSKAGARRGSWLSNIGHKLSSSQIVLSTPEKPLPTPSQTARTGNNGLVPPPSTNGRTSPLPQHTEEFEEADLSPPIKANDKSSSFFSSLTRRLSSASTSGVAKPNAIGSTCPRMVLNVDPNRERCLVPELDPSRLRKVSFCVDVEIAGGSRHYDEEDDLERKRKKKDAKFKERAEGEALKHAGTLDQDNERDEEGEVVQDSKTRSISTDGKKETSHQAHDDDADQSVPGSSPDDDRDSTSRKKEKKKKSEEERKARKEKKRQFAEESGTLPVELSPDNEEDAVAHSSPPPTSNGPTLDTPIPVGAEPDAVPQAQATPVKQDKPTTDPVRIYRRCCQLRETPILKRITEQLMSPICCIPAEPGVVNCLDLSRSRLQLSDVVTLGDWLAVVPVKQLRYEDGDLNDEGVRCILAGLLAAKKPEPTKRKSPNPKHREGVVPRPVQPRTGMVEKVCFKNNPRITSLGWKYISTFLYMCRSLKAMDLSMNKFPETLPASVHVTSNRVPQKVLKGPSDDLNAAETMFRCLSERLGGSRLEELSLSECSLTALQIRKFIDGSVACGISRLGLAGNRLDDEGLQYVSQYLQSGVCKGLDIGGNDLHGKLGILADAVTRNPKIPCWGISLAHSNIDSADLKVLLQALVRMPDFRFLDLSHNRDLCMRDNDTVSLFRRYMSQFKNLKRIHLADVGMSPKQAIALADALPDGPSLAHLNILENPMLSALASAKDEASQEEACALYASLMAAVRVSSTLVRIDIDVPSQDNCEIVKALAKQVVAYSLRNMEQFTLDEVTGVAGPTGSASTLQTEPRGGARSVKEVVVPDVLMNLVGHIDGVSENHDNAGPAPGEDYIVGGTGVVKALQYVLGEKANDLRRSSVPSTPAGGNMTPTQRPGSSAGWTEQQQGKAKKMSKNLLVSARNIRTRLQPALVKEAQGGDEMAYRRLTFLDHTLQNMIQRFEEEYPETREAPPSPKQPASVASSSLTDASNPRTDLSVNTQTTEFTSHASDDDDDAKAIKSASKRHGSEVSLASRALGAEEGHLHRLGQQLRRSIIDSPTADDVRLSALPQQDQQLRLKALGEKMAQTSGTELKQIIEHDGWPGALQKVGMSYEDLRLLQEQDPEGWEQFKESQLKARANLDRDRPGSAGGMI